MLLLYTSYAQLVNTFTPSCVYAVANFMLKRKTIMAKVKLVYKPSMAETKRPRVVAYLDDEEMKQKLEILADRRCRSVSNLLLALVRNEIEQAEKSGEI